MAPFQCINVSNSSIEGEKDWIIFGACGSRLVVQSSSGYRSTWPAEVDELPAPTSEEETIERPGKRVKLSPPSEEQTHFSCLVVSNNREHLVAVTAEDKCVRVFQIDSKCHLHQLSQRCMAKRPCSITVTSDDSTILCADKFGDVYALPLLQPPEDDQNREEAEDDESTRQKQFVPAASVLTVHSGRNRKVLEEQMKQASQGQKKMKEPLKFKHDLLLGHVSIVTDIAFAEVNGRGYILTADRDEHVRVSRGPPQAHVIEGFCYGHEAFVNKLCLVSPDLLVSGGGDDHLFVWDWLNCKLVEKLCIRDAVLKYLKEKQLSHPKLLGDEEALRVAVSGIWKVPRPQSTKREILVACEGIPALFEFKLGDSSATSNIITLSGNPLDVAFLCSGQTTFSAVVSIDNVHLAGFTTDVREDEGVHRLQSFLMQDDGQWAEEAMTGSVLDWFSREATSDKTRGSEGRGNGASTETAAKRLRDMLYGVENLRKRPGAED